MIRVSLAVAVLSLTLAPFAVADENRGHQPGPRVISSERFVLTPAHPLTADEQRALQDLGVTFEHAVAGGRYLVRVTGDDATDVAAAPTVASVVPYLPSQKIYRAAYSAVTRQLGGTARLTVRFHDDVSLDEARAAVAAAGGSLSSSFVTRFDEPKELSVNLPATSLQTLAHDPSVMAIDGPQRRKVTLNAVAAQLSHVTPLFSAPYGLSGNGVVMSIFEADGPPQSTHPEFGTRLIVDSAFKGTAGNHSTHTSGTMIASGINAAAKGMSPSATLHAFDAQPTLADGTTDTDTFFHNKGVVAPGLGSVSDNNSWGYCLGWQPAGSGCAGDLETWNGCPECFGGYDDVFVGPYDKMARTSSTLYVHSAGNDGYTGTPDFRNENPQNLQYSVHRHIDPNTGSVLDKEVFCYSQNGSGTDCPAPLCTAGTSTVTGEAHCETSQHPTYGPFKTMGLSSSGKNMIAVGAVDELSAIAPFSSRGPAADGRVKPELVAKGVHQYSTVPVSTYTYNQGTSMAAPVVAGITGLMAEQWKKTFGNNATPQQLKTLLIAGADDLGNPGPDYTFGFGLVDAQASADLIIADAAKGNRIRNGSLSAKQTLTYPLTVSSGQSSLRVVLGWFDPEVTLFGSNDLAAGTKTLVNDLDVKVITPTGSTVLPYVLDMNNASANATRGVNSVDNTEEVEIASPPAGTYQVVVTASAIGDPASSTQAYTLVANAVLGAPVAPCTDAYEPNDTTSTAYGDVVSGTSINAKVCSATDLDFFRFFPNKSGTVTVHVTATDTALTVTEFNASGNATANTVNIAAGQSGNLTFSIAGAQREYVRVSANGAVGASGAYTAAITYPFTTPSRRHVAGR
jgi:subtilisin family serine protease